MTTPTLRTLSVLVFSIALSMGLMACDDGASDSGDAANTTNTTEDAFLEAVPSTQLYGLSIDGSSGSSSQGLTVAEQGLGGEPGALRQHTEDVLRGVRGLLERTHEAMDRLTANVEPVEITRDDTTCKVWEADGQEAHWRLVSCRVDERAKKFAFVLQGRDKASTSDDDYLPVVAGEGVALPRHEGTKRGRGRVGYNLDNLASLNGAPVQGKIGLGYHALGRARVLNIGLKDVQGESFEQPLSSLYSFRHRIGQGGAFHFLTHRDLVMPAEGGEDVEFGQDGELEWGRAAVAWSTEGAARGAFAICGGTLGEGECKRVYQCWEADGDVTFQDVVDRDSEANWEPTSCREVFEDFRRPPAEEEVAPAGSDDANGAPIMAIPEATDGE